MTFVAYDEVDEVIAAVLVTYANSATVPTANAHE